MAERELKATLAEKRDGVGIITLNRPEKLNAINQDIMDDLYLSLIHISEPTRH